MKHLSKINVEQNFKTHLGEKTDELKWVYLFTVHPILSPSPFNLCMSAGYKLTKSLFPLRAKYLLLFSTTLFSYQSISLVANIYVYTFFLCRINAIDSYPI